MDDAFVNYIIPVKQSTAREDCTVSGSAAWSPSSRREVAVVHAIASISWLNAFGTGGSLY